MSQKSGINEPGTVGDTAIFITQKYSIPDE